MTDFTLPPPAWRLKEIINHWVIFEYATYRTNEELLIFGYDDGTYRATLRGNESKEVTDRLPQERWEAIYLKAIAGHALLGRTPDIVEEIF